MEGELFRSELSQRLYIILKNHVLETLHGFKGVTGIQSIIDKIILWAPVREEEINILYKKIDAESLQSLFVQVALFYVKVSFTTEKKTVRIRTPQFEDLLKAFYYRVVSSPWVSSGEIWKFDPIRLDFTFRESFRAAIMDSVHIIDEVPAKPKEEEEEVFPDDSVSSFFPEDKIPPKSNATVVRDLPSSANSVVFDRKDSQSVVSSVSHGSSSRFSGVHVPKIVRIFETEKVDEEDEDDDSIHVPLS